MNFVCDAPDNKAWFQIETEAEAILESDAMRHAVEKYFRREEAKARERYQPASCAGIERDIGLKAHVQRTMPMFLTLRDREGNALATAMLPPGGGGDLSFGAIIVGVENADPYIAQSAAIEALGQHLGIMLSRERCFPYKR